MAIRLRMVKGNYVALCAVEADQKEGDIYLDDGMHGALSTKFAQDFNSTFGDNMHYTLPVDLKISELMETQKVRDARKEFARWDEQRDLNMIYGPEDKITFGKHNGSTIKEIIEDDTSYLEWALDEVDGFELNDAAQEMLQVALDQDDPIENLF